MFDILLCVVGGKGVLVRPRTPSGSLTHTSRRCRIGESLHPHVLVLFVGQLFHVSVTNLVVLIMRPVFVDEVTVFGTIPSHLIQSVL